MRKQPNVLFIMTDQMRHDALGCVGGWTKTPNLDALAASGVLFENCITNSPVCIPARIAMQSGLYPHNTGVWANMHVAMPAEWSNWMPALRDAGYRTSVFGKTHLHPHKGDLRDREDLVHSYGLDHVDEIGGPRASAWVLSHMTSRWEALGLWDSYRKDYAERFSNKPWVTRPSVLPLEEYADSYVGSRAVEYLSSYDDRKPWFCWVSFGGPHEPWDTPEPYASMYEPSEMPEPVRRPPEMGNPRDRTPPQPAGELQRRYEIFPEIPMHDIMALRANYAGNVTLIDDQIGRILEVIRARGEEDETLVVFTSDHGEMNGDHGIVYKEVFLDPAVRVPLIVRLPAADTPDDGGRRSKALVEWFDVGPTVLEVCGVDAHETAGGFARSLVPVLRGESSRHRPFAVSEVSGEVMVMAHHWKLVLNRDGKPYLLFDRLRDPEEVENLVGVEDSEPIIADLTATAAEHLLSTAIQKNESSR